MLKDKLDLITDEKKLIRQELLCVLTSLSELKSDLEGHALLCCTLVCSGRLLLLQLRWCVCGCVVCVCVRGRSGVSLSFKTGVEINGLQLRETIAEKNAIIEEYKANHGSQPTHLCWYRHVFKKTENKSCQTHVSTPSPLYVDTYEWPSNFNF